MKRIEVNFYNSWRTLLCIVYCCAMYRLLQWEIRLSVRLLLSVTNVRCANEDSHKNNLRLVGACFISLYFKKVRWVSPNFWGWMESARENTEILTAFLWFVNKPGKISKKLQCYAIRKKGPWFKKCQHDPRVLWNLSPKMVVNAPSKWIVFLSLLIWLVHRSTNSWWRSSVTYLHELFVV